MEIDELDYLSHYGTPRRSGRYPWGSGGNTETRRSFLQWVKELFGKGMTEAQVAAGFDMTVKELRSARSVAKEEVKAADIAMAQALKDKGNANTAIAERMGIPESTVRTYLAPGAAAKTDRIAAAARMLKKEVDTGDFIDVGAGAETYANVSKEKLDAALFLLQQQGYEVHGNIKVKQLGTGNETNLRVLAPPGTEWAEVRYGTEKIRQLQMHMDDTGMNDIGLKTPLPLSPDRVGINYSTLDKDGNLVGGALEDGVMYVRPGVDDLSLGGKAYAQVRIQVGEGHYLKGMAIYKDDLPDGVDVLFNTNKLDTGNKLDALKEVTRLDDGSIDTDNPFGAQIRRQILDDDGNVSSVVNLVQEEGKWTDWKDSIASQVLSKQSPKLAEEQLNMMYERRQNEFDEIMALTNPTVRKRLLKEFAEGADASAVGLQAAQMPGQAWHVILPMNSLKPTEVYAPNYQNGDRVALIRYPHGGTFEIPELTVNNRNAPARKLLKDAKDAIGINSEVASRLSGADFDGDTVLVIPNNKGKIKSTPALEGLKDFDPQTAYPGYKGMKRMSDTQKQMGVVSNLITDMTIRGASNDEIARAVRHSMVVIDAEKHGLNYKLSYERNGIRALQEKYQDGGASTIVSRAGREQRVLDRKPRPASEGGPINRRTGELEFVPTGKTSYKTGKPVTIKSKELAEARDARKLSSGTRIENIYADHSNRMKSLANQARKETLKIPRAPWSPSAKETYSAEVTSLNAKLALAEENRPRERQAQIIANATVKMRKDANPNMDYATEKKIGYQALEEARTRVGAKKERIDVTPKEWEAIQANALSDTKVERILNNADMDKIREHATPKTRLLMTGSKTKRAQSMLAAGYTRAEVAKQLGVSLSTLDRSLDGE